MNVRAHLSQIEKYEEKIFSQFLHFSKVRSAQLERGAPPLSLRSVFTGGGKINVSFGCILKQLENEKNYGFMAFFPLLGTKSEKRLYLLNPIFNLPSPLKRLYSPLFSAS